MRLHIERQTSRLPRAARIGVIALMLGLWLGLVGAASSEQWHGFLHADAGDTSHDCLIAHFAKGQFLMAGWTVFVVAAGCAFFFLLPLLERFPISSAVLGLPASRGPPAMSLLP